MNQYYIYVYCDPRQAWAHYYYEALNLTFPYKPIYIGKGKKDRYKVHVRKAKIHDNDPFHNRLRSMVNRGVEPFSSILYEGLSEDEAFVLEKQVIEIIGRKNTGTGPLLNLSEGGPFFYYSPKMIRDGEHPASSLRFLIVDPLGTIYHVPKGTLGLFSRERNLTRNVFVESALRLEETGRIHKSIRGKSQNWFAIFLTEQEDNEVSTLDNQQLFVWLKNKCCETGEDLSVVMSSKDTRPYLMTFRENWNASFSRDYARGEKNVMHKEEHKHKMLRSRMEKAARRNGFSSDDDAVKQINALWDEGKTIPEIRAQFSCSENFVRFRILSHAYCNPLYKEFNDYRNAVPVGQPAK